MPKSTQTRFLGIRDNHNHYTSLLLLCIDLLMSTYPRHAILSVLDLHVGDIYLEHLVLACTIVLMNDLSLNR